MEAKLTQIKSAVDELFSLLGIDAQTSVEEVDGYYHVTIAENETSGLLIGKQGDTLYSIQLILSFVLKNKIGEEVKLVLDIGDYREKQKSYLENLAEKAYQHLLETGQPQYLYNLNPSQRRVVHTYLAEKGDVVSESEGEGEERQLVIKKKA